MNFFLYTFVFIFLLCPIYRVELIYAYDKNDLCQNKETTNLPDLFAEEQQNEQRLREKFQLKHATLGLGKKWHHFYTDDDPCKNREAFEYIEGIVDVLGFLWVLDLERSSLLTSEELVQKFNTYGENNKLFNKGHTVIIFLSFLKKHDLLEIYGNNEDSNFHITLMKNTLINLK